MLDHSHDHRHLPGAHGAHGMAAHGHARPNFGRAFAIGVALNAAYVVAEVFYGVVSHSLALLADAGHNLGDVLALAAAWGASILGQRRPAGRYTYGFRGSTILVALGNAVLLLVITGGIAWEAIRRLQSPEPLSGMIVVITWSVLRDSINLALHAVPSGIEREAVADYLGSLPGITAVHDLHIWGMSTTETALTAHLVRPEGVPTEALLRRAQHELQERFGIGHVTLQVETADEAVICRLAPDDIV